MQGIRNMSKEKIINKRIVGFVTCFFIMLIFTLFWFALDEMVLAIICILISILQMAFILITPYCYIFSEEHLTIKYCFGLQENIPWQYVRAIVKSHENAFKYITLDTYKIFYYCEETQPFFMQGVVSKNKATAELMKKYCSNKMSR